MREDMDVVKVSDLLSVQREKEGLVPDLMIFNTGPECCQVSGQHKLGLFGLRAFRYGDDPISILK